MRKKIIRFVFYFLFAALPAIVFFSSLSCGNSVQQEAGLHYIVREPKIKSAKPPLLILLHGIGSNEEDLFSFADKLPEKYLVVSARAPIPLGGNVFAWYKINWSADQHARVFDFKEEEQSRQMIIDFIGRLKNKYAFDTQQVYLCGFSQGAILSYSVALTRPDVVRGIAVMSGRLLEEIKPMVASKEKLTQLKVFVSHGTNDPTIQIADARAAVAYIKTLGINPLFNEYSEGHGINANMLDDLISWLK